MQNKEDIKIINNTKKKKWWFSFLNNLQIFNKKKKLAYKKKHTQIRNENLKWKNPFTCILTKRVKLLCALLVNFEYAIEFDISFLFEYCSYVSSPHMWVNNNNQFSFILESRLMFANAWLGKELYICYWMIWS